MKTVFLNHVPKTAGTTVHTFLRKIMGIEKFAFFKDDDSMTFTGNFPEAIGIHGVKCVDKLCKRVPKEALLFEATRLVSGHFAFGLHEIFPNEAILYTILRDPVERVLSKYYYMKQTVDSPQHQNFHKAGLKSLRDFLRWEEVLGVNNGMIRQLAPCMWVPWLDINDWHMREALKNIQKCQVVGFAEEMELSLTRMAHCLGVREFELPKKKENVSNRPPSSEEDPADIELIKVLNKWDMKLYEIAHFAELEFPEEPTHAN